MINSQKLVDGYLDKSDWRVNENSNACPTIGALSKHLSGEVSKEYWLQEVYDQENPMIGRAHRDGFFHIHDLSALTLYCCGYSLRKVLDMGIQGVPNIPRSKPASHFDSALAQVVNLTSIFQNEIAGAVAFSSVDTLLAPYIKKDSLRYKEVKQYLQNFIYAINSNSRYGAEPAFSNVTLDLRVPEDLADQEVVIAGQEQPFTYADCQPEMDLFNRALLDLYLEGDADGKPFSYPIPTYGITKDFEWDTELSSKLFELAGKYGTPYFSNFLNSDMNPSDARSMCCRLRLDLRALVKRNGGLFGSGDSTGAIGVVTLNLPRYAYLAKKEAERRPQLSAIDVFYDILYTYAELAKDSLVIKRNFLQEKILDVGLLPAFMRYVGTMDNHFNVIGHVGLNETVAMLLENEGIVTPIGKALAEKILDKLSSLLGDYQSETGQLFNLEATPAESTCYRLASLDKKEFPDILTQGPETAPYYTNSCHLPVKTKLTLKQLFDHQDSLQTKYTGGTVVHIYAGGSISSEQAKHIIKTIFENYKLPYVSISPVVTLCPEHGRLDHRAENCPFCGKKTRQMQRITGYVRDTEYWNPGKKSEYADRQQFQMFDI